MRDGEHDPDGMAPLLELARRAACAPVDPALHAAGRQRVIDATPPAREAARGKLAPALIGAAAVAAALALGLWSALVLRQQPLRYRIDGGEVAARYLDAPPDAPATLRFSDGSEFDAQPSARLRIDAVRSNGARLLVERGTAAAHVVHRPGAEWLLIAGPFEVRVTGTRFTISWDPAAEAIDLTLQEGSVEVESPVGPDHLTVRAGQRFRASVRQSTLKLEAARTEARGQSGTTTPTGTGTSTGTPTTTSTTTPATTTTTAAATTATAAGGGARDLEGKGGGIARAGADERARSAKPAGPEQWPELVRRGEFQAVVEAALARGVEESLASCGAQSARALADAARYTDHTQVAERALLALRARFAGTRHSAAAAFLLGRTEESAGRPREADRWYRVYLDEAPDGELAADSLAGRMRAAISLGDNAAARPLARQYLQRYPAGVHAEAARHLLGLH